MKSQQELVSTETCECTSWRWLRKEPSVLPVNCGVCLPHNWRAQCMIFLASYSGSSPCRKMGEEPGYEARNIIHSVLQLWCVSASLSDSTCSDSVVAVWFMWTLVIKGCVSWQCETLILFMGSFSAGEEAWGCTLGSKRLWRLYDKSCKDPGNIHCEVKARGEPGTCVAQAGVAKIVGTYVMQQKLGRAWEHAFR